ncbi:MAG TPA: hypothetical protein VGI17_07310 [Solirubrobacterales bacterium]|jgi:hypothetical protein
MAYAEQLDGAVLATLCGEPGPWPIGELMREYEGSLHARDALMRLINRGLVLRIGDDLVVTSAAGRYAHAVDEAQG